MKKTVWTVVLIGIIWFFSLGKTPPGGDVIESSGVEFEKKNFTETLTKAQEEKKNILVDVFSFN